MDKNKFLVGLREQFEETDSLNLEMNTSFKDMKTWDSLTRFSIIAFLEDEYNISFKNEDFTNFSTPELLFEFIYNK
jgi:acyl carrier protein